MRAGLRPRIGTRNAECAGSTSIKALVGDDGSAEGLVSFPLCFVCLSESVVEAHRNVYDVNLCDCSTRAAPYEQHVRGYVPVLGAVGPCSRLDPLAPDQVGRDRDCECSYKSQ